MEQRKIVTPLPENSETPLDSVRSWVTPNRLFFVRNHFDVPVIDPAAYRLQLTGCVERQRVWTLEELARLPQRSVFATMECAGNGRSFLRPHAHGVPWGAGAIGHAEWTGVPLRDVLEECKPTAAALEVLFEGADRGAEADHPEPMSFARSLPLAKALDRDTLLVTHMNGEPLEPNHGFPVRLLVPGWYGVASVKWLSRIEVIREPFKGYFQNNKYTVQRRSSDGVQTVIVGPMAVKSEFIRPHLGEALGIGTNRIFGVAWGGSESIARVDVSTDGGRTWQAADLIGPQSANSWTMWELLWEVATPGDYELLARAVAAGGAMQPAEHDPLNGGYCINFSRPRPVRVVATRQVVDQRGSADLLQYDMNAFAEDNVRFPLDVELDFVGGEGI
jgi:DMSO/TMAO reductase YedYZ molybdopterin-dependent catalytic subunit